jgi:hypothetical protein
MLNIFSFLGGVLIVLFTLRSAVRTYLLPRSARDALAAATFITLRAIFNLGLRFFPSYRTRDRVLAYYIPVAILVLLGVWLSCLVAGYTFMFWSLGVQVPSLNEWEAAFYVSGSSLFTLGYAPVETLSQKILSFSAAAMGPVLIALLIGYMPTIYGAFSKRETLVTLLEVRAGSPPSAVDMICRFHRIHGVSKLTEMWIVWETWFAELEETHTSLAMLNFLRSPVPDHSWVNAAGAVLDAAALTLAVVDTPNMPQAHLCLRAGYIALRRIADYFNIAYNPDPEPTDPISVTQTEFNNAVELLTVEGVPLKKDRAQAWRAYAGWRVNYDAVLIKLAKLTEAPPAPWTSPLVRDQRRPPLVGKGA